MKTTVAFDYALYVLMDLACHHGEWVSCKELTARLGLSLHFLHKVCHRLAIAQLLEAKKRKGYRLKLNRLPDDINLFDIMTAIDGEFHLQPATRDKTEYSVAASHVLKEIELRIKELFQHASLECFISTKFSHKEISRTLLNQAP